LRQTSELLTCRFSWATSTPQQEQGEVFIPTGVQCEAAEAGGVGGGVGNMELAVAGDGCGGCGGGVGGVSSWCFLFPNVSLFLTTAGVAGDGCGGCGRGVGGVSS
jgi:hypothetical protein